jgi:hypothetical protein
MTRVVIYFSIFLFTSSNAFSQAKNNKGTNEIIDPIEFLCWKLFPDSAIRPLILNSKYKGAVIITAKMDTTNYILTDYKIVFVKLRSNSNNNDTIEIRLNNKIGYINFVDSIQNVLISHLYYLKVKHSNIKDCQKNSLIVTIPIQIE